MDYHTTTRIPVNDKYAALVGKALYVFAYYEWTVIYIIDYLENGFVNHYSRGKPMTSGVVSKHFETAISKNTLISLSTKADLLNCYTDFSNLIDKRNALIHAHPITDIDGSQILAYQANPQKTISDISWPDNEVEGLIDEIDKAAVEAGLALAKLRKST